MRMSEKVGIKLRHRAKTSLSPLGEREEENGNELGTSPVEVLMPGLSRWSQMRLMWKDKEQKSWKSFDFRSSFDGTKVRKKSRWKVHFIQI